MKKIRVTKPNILGKSSILLIALFIIVFDFVTKYIIRLFHPSIKILPFFSIEYITNTGIAFGMLKGYNWVFIILTLVLLVVFFYYYNRIPSTPFYIISISMILGGAVGNLIDRIFLGYVTDFISFSFWPAFNVADSSISIGAVMLLILIIKSD